MNEDYSDIVPMADLTLVVGPPAGSTRKFKANRDTLRRASSEFYHMLDPDGPFKENPATEVPFPHDDPIDFEILLLLLHDKFDDYEDNYDSRDDLTAFFMFLDRYGLVEVGRSALKKWIKSGKWAVSEELAMCGYHEETLAIAWCYGNKDVYEQMLQRMILKSVFQDTGYWAWQQDALGAEPPGSKEYEVVQEHLLPDSLRGRIENAMEVRRQEIIMQLPL